MTNHHEQHALPGRSPLQREQIGPFLLLGIEKDADARTIEAHWAQRVIWARKNQLGASLADVNWAREVLSDFAQRVRADVASLNADTAAHTLRQLAERYGVAEAGGPTWEPIDVELPPAAYAPAVELPDAETLRRAIVPPEIPWETPAAVQVLESFIREPLHPWNLPPAEEQSE